jgi:glycosyltransferase involved in cell wall biosynthesis
MKSFTLAILVDRYWPARGGVEQAMASLAASLPSDWRVTIITHHPSTADTLFGRYTSVQKMPANDPSGRVIEPLEPGRFGRLLLLPLLLWNLPPLRTLLPHVLYDLLYFWYKKAFFRQVSGFIEDADSVHCCSTGYLARCVTDVCLKKGVRFFHQPFVHFGRWGDTPAQLRAYACADAVICPTVTFKKKFLDRAGDSGAAEAVVIPPVMTEAVYPKLRMPPVPGRFILFLGRREAHKGLATLLVAFNGLEGLASLVVAGPGEQVHMRNMSVFDLGEVDEKIKNWLLSSCDVFCLPSSDESFGIVFAEAMGFGKPIVAYDIAPVNEIVAHGKTGLLVPIDDTDGLRNALETLLQNGHLRKKLGAAGKLRYERLFSRDVVLSRLVQLYRPDRQTLSAPVSV